MGICGSLMDIFDYPQARSANKINFRLYRLLYIIGVPFEMKITKFPRL